MCRLLISYKLSVPCRLLTLRKYLAGYTFIMFVRFSFSMLVLHQSYQKEDLVLLSLNCNFFVPKPVLCQNQFCAGFNGATIFPIDSMANVCA